MATSHSIDRDIKKEPAIEAIDRNLDHLADFLCPPAEWALKLREKGFLTGGTFEKATNDSSSETNKKKATRMIGDIQRCIRVDDPNSFKVLVNLIKQDTHGNSLAKKLITSYKANRGGSEIDCDHDDNMHLENHDCIVDSPSDQQLRSVTRRTSSNHSLRSSPNHSLRSSSNQSLRSLRRFDIESLSQSSLPPINSSTSNIFDSILMRPPSNMSISDHPSCCDRDSVLQQLSDSEVSSDENESYSDSEISSESTGIARSKFQGQLFHVGKILKATLSEWKWSFVIKLIFLFEIVASNIWAVYYIAYVWFYKGEYNLPGIFVLLWAGFIIAMSLFAIFYCAYVKIYLGLKDGSHCVKNWRGKKGQHITRRKYWERIERAVVCLQVEGSSFSGFVVKLNAENVLIVSCLHCFETPTGLQAKDSKSQWKSVCRRVKRCKFRFHYISSNSYQERAGKELLWCGSSEKKNLFVDPVRDLLAVRINIGALPQCVTPLDASVMRSYLQDRTTSEHCYWLECHVTILGHPNGISLCQSGGVVVNVEEKDERICYEARTEDGHTGGPVVVTMMRKDKTMPVVIAVHSDADPMFRECNRGQLLWPFLDDIDCRKTPIMKCISI